MKASRVAAEQAKSLESLSKLVMALCEKQGIDVDKVLGTEEPQTREAMKAYAFQTKLPAPTPAAESAVPAPAAAKEKPAKGKK
jgi:hypothetical protein